MDFDAFSGGIEPGGLRSKSDIGVLICYMLHNIDAPFAKEDILNIIQENAIANYFETISAIEELIKCGNIEYADEKEEMLMITRNGKLISSQLYTTLSVTLRQKTIGAIMRLVTQKRLEKENPVTVSGAEGGGYNVNFRITDGMRDLMSLTLFVPTIEEVKEVKRHFYQCPDKIYSTVLASVVGDDDMIAEALRDLKR